MMEFTYKEIRRLTDEFVASVGKPPTHVVVNNSGYAKLRSAHDDRGIWMDSESNLMLYGYYVLVLARKETDKLALIRIDMRTEDKDAML